MPSRTDMPLRTVALFAAGLVSVAVLTSGCLGFNAGGSSAPAATEAVPSPADTSAHDDVVAALQKTQSAPYRFAVEADLPDGVTVSATGAYDPVGKLLETTGKITGGTAPGTHHRVYIGNDGYIRDNDDPSWVHVDLLRVKDNILFYFDVTDPTGLATFGAKVVSARRAGPLEYSGLFDPNANKPRFLPVGAPSLIGIGLRAAPFTVTTDDQGRVTVIRVEVSRPEGAKLVMTTTFSAHGVALTTKAPAKASVLEADDGLYE